MLRLSVAMLGVAVRRRAKAKPCMAGKGIAGRSFAKAKQSRALRCKGKAGHGDAPPSKGLAWLRKAVRSKGKALRSKA